MPQNELGETAKSVGETASKVGKSVSKSVSKTGQNFQKTFKRIWAWVKDHPAIAGVLVGGVVLLALLRGNKNSGISSNVEETKPLDDLGLGETGGLGSLGFGDNYNPPSNLGQLLYDTPSETALPQTEGTISYFTQEPNTIPSGTLDPERDSEYFIGRAKELGELAGEVDDPSAKSLLAQASRWTGSAGMYYQELEAGNTSREEYYNRYRSASRTQKSGSLPKPSGPSRFSLIQQYYQEQQANQVSNRSRQTEQEAVSGRPSRSVDRRQYSQPRYETSLSQSQQANADRLSSLAGQYQKTSQDLSRGDRQLIEKSNLQNLF